ncbi:MAG: YebC/PmpR family DNA-binding transcriptional regulator, partial [Deltaproteobacteria bacterium]
LFSKYGGNLGENGCVAWIFDKLGHVLVSCRGVVEEELFDAAVEAGASNVSLEGETFVVTTGVDDLEAVRAALVEKNFEVESAEIVLEPKNVVELSGGEASSALKLLEFLEDHDDVQRVSANFDIDEEELSRLSA